MLSYNFEEFEVLVVDDNRHMCTLIRDLLGAIGISRVAKANDGMSGFQQLRNCEPDVFVTELNYSADRQPAVCSHGARRAPFAAALFSDCHGDGICSHGARRGGA
jgi:CheY-like chemotaxis protein